MKKKNYLVTGATGFLGGCLIHRLLERDDIHLHLLVRGSEKKSAHERVLDLLKNKSDIERITAYNGDISKKNLGLEQETWNDLATKIDTIIHSAASIQFDLPLEKARQINTQGTASLLELAYECHKNGVLEKHCHLSTAYVSGKTPHFRETELDVGQSFNNSYEQSKNEAEKLVHEYIKKGLPIMIFRPSITSGDNVTGHVAENSITFDFMKLLSMYKLTDYLCDEDSSLNIISVDYVIDALLHISANPENIGKTFNLTNDKNKVLSELLSDFSSLLDYPMPKLIPFAEKEKASKKTRIALRPLFGYYEIGHTFDNSQTRQALAGSGIQSTPISYEFLSRVVAYCREKNFNF